MYLREALSRCREMKVAVARMYDELALEHAGVAEVRNGFHRLAACERRHAQALAALLMIHEALDDDGPFLVGCEARARRVQRQVLRSEVGMREDVSVRRGLELRGSLEEAEFEELVADLYELARPSLKRFTRWVGADQSMPELTAHLAEIASLTDRWSPNVATSAVPGAGAGRRAERVS